MDVETDDLCEPLCLTGIVYSTSYVMADIRYWDVETDDVCVTQCVAVMADIMYLVCPGIWRLIICVCPCVSL